MKLSNKNHEGLLKKYSLSFLIVYLIVFLPISIKNFNIGFTGLYSDGFSQHLLFMRDYIIKIKDFLFNNGDFYTFSFNIGYGADIVSSYSYYSLFDPFNIIAIILPTKWIEFSFYLIIYIKMFLSGYFFCLLSKKFNIKSTKIIVISGVFYAINLCALTSILKHPIFASSFMILPLVILGAEKAIRNESKILLIISVSLSIISQFYLGAYIIFSLELYFMFRLCKDKLSFKQWLSKMIKLNVYVFLGLLISSFVLLTQLYAMTSNGRSSSNEMIIYSFEYYTGLIYTFLIPVPSFPYTIGIGNAVATFLIVLFILFYNGDKWLKKLILFEFSLLLFSIFGYTLSLFSYVNNRWSFVIMVPLVLSMAISLDNYKLYTKHNLNSVLKSIVVIAIVGAFLGTIYVIFDYFELGLLLSVFVLIIDVIIFIFILKKIIKINFANLKINYSFIEKKFLEIQVFLMIFFSVGMCFYNTQDYVFDEYYKNEVTSEMLNDTSFYRVSKSEYVMNLEFFANDSIYGNYSSTFSYNSMNNGNIIDMINYFNVSNDNGNVGYNGLDNRYILETLFGVKYYINKESTNNSIPYNFSYYDSYKSIKFEEKDFEKLYGQFEENQIEKTNIYINNNYLSLGYVYDAYLNYDDLENLSGLERQEVILDAVILEKSLDSQSLYSYDLTNISQIDYSLELSDGIKIYDNEIVVTKKDAYITLNVNDVENSELYVSFKGIKNKNTKKKTILTYEGMNVTNTEITRKVGSNHYVDNSNQLINLGYYENEENEKIKIIFSNKGNYVYESIELFRFNMQEVLSKIEILQENQLENININGNVITGSIDSNKDGILLLTIPYNKGFKAYVNGKETEIYKANVGFMAIKIEEGFSEIKLTYNTVLLKEGLIISCIGIGILIIYIPIEIYFRKKKNKIIDSNEYSCC